ncbi:MAG: AAA family ATPase, partial [Gammaproteobacteria bacterium]|nr:AAA family ATPase [Gammaproteobacteria bacterium]
MPAAPDEEIKILEQVYQSKSPEFLALYGRRRIGKTFLIREFFSKKKNGIFFNITGAKNSPMKEQIQHFTAQLSKAFYSGIKLQAGKNWDEAFSQLTKTIKEQVVKNKKIILFFDELPWMATPRSRVLEMLDYYWNQHWSQDKRIKLIICGSSAAWIINKVINNPGGLHNRVTREIRLEPYNLLQTKQFLHAHNIKLNDRQILQIYMVTGGIPFYLSKIEKGLSASQIIESLSFSKTGFLLDEFDKLFSSFFDNSEDYITLVKLLAHNRYG